MSITANGVPVTYVPAETVVTLTATVTAGANVARPGTVNFCDATSKYCTDIHLIGTAQLTNAGTAVYKFRPGAGIHSYKAVFIGTNTYTASSSAASSLTVPGDGVTLLTATGSPGNYTLTAAVPGSATATPSGNVSFLDTTNANYLLGSSSLVAGPTGVGFLNTNPATGQAPNFMVWGDFNGDGIPDIAISNLGGFSITILLGNGDGTFEQGNVISTPTYQTNNLVAGDFNNDGRLDLAVRTNPTMINMPSIITVFLGNGDGTFTIHAGPSLEPSAFGIALGDFNNDGNLDLAISNGASVPLNSSVTILLGNGDGTFNSVAAQPSTDSAADSLIAGDFNGDGKTDLAVAGGYYKLDILLGNGDGTFAPASSMPSDPDSTDIVAGDWNGDGKLDLAVSTVGFAGYSLDIYLGNGDGTFLEQPRSLLGVDSYSLAFGDLNGDGIPDLVLSDYGADNLDLLLGKGDGTFTKSPIKPGVGSGPISVVVDDLNGDGVPDLAVANQNSNNVSILLTLPKYYSTATITGVSVVGTGTHYAEATYPGDSNFPASVSNLVPLIATLEPTTATLTAAPTVAAIGSPVLLTATVAPDTAQDHNATGTVTFTSGLVAPVALGTVPLSNGTAVLDTTTLPVGTNQITCAYSGDTNFAASTCNTVSVTIANISLTLSSSMNPSPPLSPVTFTATLLLNGQPAGAGNTISLTLNGQTVTLTTAANGSATYTTSTLPPGSNLVTATFAASGSLPAASASLTEVITRYPSTVGLTASPNPVFVTNTETLTATVSGGSLTATGLVTFLDGTTPIGTATLSGGSAALTTSTLTLGTHTITASYAGDANFAPAISPPVSVIVEDFALTIANSPLTIHHGGTAVFNLSLNAVGGPVIASPITLTVSGNPDHAPVTFSPATVPATAASAAATLTIATPDYPVGPWSSVHKPTYFRARTTSLALLALGGLLLPFTRRSRRKLQHLATVLLFLAASLLLGSASGCGSGWGGQSYHITVTAASGNLSHTATATLVTEP